MNHMIPHGQCVNLDDLYSACNNFYNAHKTLPDTMKMDYWNLTQFLKMIQHQPIVNLEADKKYTQYLIIPGGMVEVCILEECNETMSGCAGTMMVLECSKIDREFEKHVLNKE